ncbi:MAG: GH25 family lysozyme [Enterococcus canintestini]|uniref:GH25 family lysozyme n=2 Tax=Enterococcus canintestini TaxID=317010 RepID=UPI00163CF2A4
MTMLNGIDVSSWQGDIQVQNMALDFVIVKTTGGGGGGFGYVNPFADRVYQRAKKAGKLLGFYHYAHEIGFQGSAIDEADFFIKNSKNYFGEAIPILDWESDNKHDVAWAKAFLDRVYARTGVKPLFYTYTAVINSNDFSSIAKADYGLWIANYGLNAVTNGFRQPQPPKSKGWAITAMFQYNSQTRLPGYGGLLDANVFYGDVNAWKAYAAVNGKSEKPTPTPEPSKPNPTLIGEIKMKEFTLNTNVNLRTAATTSAPIIALLKKGQKVKFNDIVLAGGYLWAVQPRTDQFKKGYISLGEINSYGLIR